jgi:hypothetical protein
MVKQELQKLLDAGIITPTRHTTWLSNPVIVRKKMGQIRLCVDFKILTRLASKTTILFQIWRSFTEDYRFKMLSFLDGFSGYNQVLVNHEDRKKMTFTTPWGTYEYIRMPFGFAKCRSYFSASHGLCLQRSYQEDN